jgi:hypothetical protein
MEEQQRGLLGTGVIFTLLPKKNFIIRNEMPFCCVSRQNFSYLAGKNFAHQYSGDALTDSI